MDWPTRNLRSRVRWLALTFRSRLGRSHAPPALVGAVPRTPASRCRGALGLIERLYSLERTEGRPPLLVLTATDSNGHLAQAVICDSEDYQ